MSCSAIVVLSLPGLDSRLGRPAGAVPAVRPRMNAHSETNFPQRADLTTFYWICPV